MAASSWPTTSSLAPVLGARAERRNVRSRAVSGTPASARSVRSARTAVTSCEGTDLTLVLGADGVEESHAGEDLVELVGADEDVAGGADDAVGLELVDEAAGLGEPDA